MDEGLTVRRAQPPAPPPSLQGNAAAQERQAVLDFYADPANRSSKYPRGYKAYANDDVRDTLNRAFGFKCAYCESSYGATQPVAIEHYRPKGSVILDAVQPDGKTKPVLTPPGYYWLASEWQNLLPACTDCNSPRAQDLPEGVRETAGKANKFPIASERRRAHLPGEEAGEGRLLLHPYFDDPAEHLHYVEDPTGFRDGEVEPRPRGRSGRPSAKGRASIEVYALQRRGLIDARKAMLTRVRLALMDVQDDLDEINAEGLTPRLKARYERHTAELKAFTDPGQEYSAMCAQVIDDAFERLFGRRPA